MRGACSQNILNPGPQAPWLKNSNNQKLTGLIIVVRGAPGQPGSLPGCLLLIATIHPALLTEDLASNQKTTHAVLAELRKKGRPKITLADP